MLDLGLPGMNGHELAERLGVEPFGRDFDPGGPGPGYGQEDRRRTHEAGFDHHLTKAANLAVLAATPPERQRMTSGGGHARTSSVKSSFAYPNWRPP